MASDMSDLVERLREKVREHRAFWPLMEEAADQIEALGQERDLNWLPPHKCGLYLEHNAHRDVYESVVDHYDADNFPTPEDFQQSVDTDEVWTLQWYPDTPVGFHVISAPTLERLMAPLGEKG